MVQPLSASRGLLIVPLTWTAVLRPGMSQRILRLAAVAVGLLQAQVPDGVEGVHLQLGVVVVVAVRIEEDLEVVVFVEDVGIVLGVGALDVRLLQLGADVEILVVPEHLGAGAEARLDAPVALDVHEVVGPRGAFQAPSSSRPSKVHRAGCAVRRRSRAAGRRRRRRGRAPAGDRLSQTRTVPSPEAEISRVPSGLQATAWT